MSVVVTFFCDDCGLEAEHTSLMPISDWEETDDGEDLCPVCAAGRAAYEQGMKAVAP